MWSLGHHPDSGSRLDCFQCLGRHPESGFRLDCVGLRFQGLGSSLMHMGIPVHLLKYGSP